jgi:hypothetical protein
VLHLYQLGPVTVSFTAMPTIAPTDIAYNGGNSFAYVSNGSAIFKAVVP